MRSWSDRGCAGWSASLLFAYGINRFSHDVTQLLTHISLALGKQSRPWSDAAKRGVWSGSPLFAKSKRKKKVHYTSKIGNGHIQLTMMEKFTRRIWVLILSADALVKILRQTGDTAKYQKAVRKCPNQKSHSTLIRNKDNKPTSPFFPFFLELWLFAN